MSIQRAGIDLSLYQQRAIAPFENRFFNYWSKT
jgi:hypothetical protein